jgi:penicillin-binding protein
MGSPSEEEVEAAEAAGETLNVSVGQTGIEAAFEDTLKGSDGRIIYIEDDKGEVKEVLWEDAKSDGSDIYLTLDTGLQNTAYTLLAANCAEGQSGAAVVMDYTNGDVKAMVSYPSFDNNLFNPVAKDVWDYYSAEDNQDPLFPRATQSTYMPGSALKPFSAVPAIESGILTESSSPPITVEDNKWLPKMEGWHFPTINRFETPVGGDWVFEIAMKFAMTYFCA